MDNLKEFKGKFVKADIRTADYDRLASLTLFFIIGDYETTVTDSKAMFSTNVKRL